VLAAHATEPAHDGASIRSVAFRDQFLKHGCDVVWVGPHSQTRHVSSQTFVGRDKYIAAARTILNRSHYLRERHAHANWSRAMRSAIALANSETVIWGNFVWTYAEWAHAGGTGRFFLDTHNSEREWYENLSAGSRNPLVRGVAASSIAYAEGLVRGLPASVTCVHVSDRDRMYYETLAPQSRHIVVPNGCSLRPVKALPRRPGMPRLYFLGSLGVQMNYDALHHFATHFWPLLRPHCSFAVFGSSPSPDIRQLCQSQKWPLKPDLVDADLDRELRDFDVAILPFAYGAGTKLKFTDALSRGMHVLTTPEGTSGISCLPRTVVAARTGQEWLSALTRFDLDTAAAVEASTTYARAVSWDQVIGAFLRGSHSPMHS
jgi:hypothetical protein